MGVRIPGWAVGMEVTSTTSTEMSFAFRPEEGASVYLHIRDSAGGSTPVSYTVVHTYGGKRYCKLEGTLHCSEWSSERLQRHFELIATRMALLVPAES